jgi:predicted transposase YdaD
MQLHMTSSRLPAMTPMRDLHSSRARQPMSMWLLLENSGTQSASAVARSTVTHADDQASAVTERTAFLSALLKI